jgi:hypothetical protein
MGSYPLDAIPKFTRESTVWMLNHATQASNPAIDPDNENRISAISLKRRSKQDVV